ARTRHALHPPSRTPARPPPPATPSAAKMSAACLVTPFRSALSGRGRAAQAHVCKWDREALICAPSARELAWRGNAAGERHDIPTRLARTRSRLDDLGPWLKQRGAAQPATAQSGGTSAHLAKPRHALLPAGGAGHALYQRRSAPSGLS